MDIIKDLFDIWKRKRNLVDFETGAVQVMYEWMCQAVGRMLTEMNRALTQLKQKEGWKVERTDERTLQFLFGPVTFSHTLMIAPNHQRLYPLDRLMKWRKGSRYSPYVELKAAELAGRMPYRQVVETLETWTPIKMSHSTVMASVCRVGAAQGQMDEALVEKDKAGTLTSEGRMVTHLMTEADGTYVRGMQKKTHIEIKHLITYEGWEQNGKRRRLVNPYAVMTTKNMNDFWDQATAVAESRYDLTHTQVVANSDGGSGYGEERFKEAFSGSRRPLFVQLDAFHVAQALTRALHGDKDWLKAAKKAVRDKQSETLVAILDTYESHLESDPQIQKVEDVKKYLKNHWSRLFDWRDQDKQTPEVAGKLGAMESNQRHLTFRMKKRGMHWGGSVEAMVKVIQGCQNGTLQAAYLASLELGERAMRRMTKTMRIATLLRSQTRPSIGVHLGRIAGYTSASSSVGHLNKILTS